MEIVSVTSKIPKVNLLQWLASQDSQHKVFVKLRDHNYSVAGFGNLLESPKAQISFLDWTIEDYEDFIADNKDLNLFVAAPFYLNNETIKFNIPRFEVTQDGNDYSLTVRRWESESPDEFQGQVNLSLEPFNKLSNSIVESSTNPDFETWKKYFSKAQDAFAGIFKKLVLARTTNYLFEEPLCAFSILNALEQPSYQSLFQWESDAQWIAVSPERLFRIEEGQMYTEALAGTGTNPEDLKNSKKDILEHNLVIEDIKGKLTGFNLDIRDTETIPSKKLFHLKTEIDLEYDKAASEALRTLHPTAALGGLPSSEALKWLKSNEPFAREYFGAPFGIVNNNFSEFFVNIRSAHVSGNRLKLFSGCGIVPASNVDAEWSEMDQKIAQYLEILK